MQNYFCAPGAQGEIPMAREIVPAINRLAAAMRAVGQPVIWVQTSTNDTLPTGRSCTDHLMSPPRAAKRLGGDGRGERGI